MTWFQKRGLVAKVVANNCIVLTPEGTFVKIPVPSPDIKVGAEVLYRHPGLTSPVKPWLLAASLLVFFMGCFLWDQVMLPQAVAYISLDINHGVEMAVDKDLRVIGVKCFDDGAADLVKQLNLEGKGLNEAVAQVVNQAIEQDYIKAGQENLMISTVSPSGTALNPVDKEDLYQVLEKTIAARGCSGNVKIYAASDEFRQAAEEEKLSAGKYLLYEQAVKSGQEITVADINRKSVSQVADTYQLDLLPNYKKLNVQAAANKKDKQVTVEDNGQDVAIQEYFRNQAFQGVAAEMRNNRSNPSVSRSYAVRDSREIPSVTVASVTADTEAGDNNRQAVAEDGGGFTPKSSKGKGYSRN